MITGANVDLDKELRHIGFANLLAGLCLTTPNYMPLGNNSTHFRMGGSQRSGFIILFLAICSLWLATTLGTMIPTPMMCCFFTWLGFSFLRDALAIKPAHGTDRPIVLLMAVLMLGLGYLEGLLIGLLLACLRCVRLFADPFIFFAANDHCSSSAFPTSLSLKLHLELLCIIHYKAHLRWAPLSVECAARSADNACIAASCS